MSITIEDATVTASGLLDASRKVQVRQLRYELAKRADEWDRAARMAADYEDVAIEMVGSVIPGMLVVPFESARDDEPQPILRVLHGGLSLHLESKYSPQGTYRNFSHPSSPVVVQA